MSDALCADSNAAIVSVAANTAVRIRAALITVGTFKWIVPGILTLKWCYISAMRFTFLAKLCRPLLVFTCISIPAFGQEMSRINFGITAGAPVQRVLRYQPNQYENLFSLVNTHDDDSFPIVIGPTLTLNITNYVAFETGALYRPIRLNELYIPSFPMPSGPVSPDTREGRWWEFPLLGTVRFPGRTMRPFTKIGIVPHSERIQAGAFSSRHFRITSTSGFALGGGVEWNGWRIGISPELRYSRWTNRYSNLGWSATPNRLDVLVGFSIH